MKLLVMLKIIRYSILKNYRISV